MKLGNYSEQYSRKHNIRVVNLPEQIDENLKENFQTIVKDLLKVDIESQDIPTIHRIPGKDNDIRPFIVKMRNTEVKVKVMRAKTGLQKGDKFHDDTTLKTDDKTEEH